jgi:hypothetical protein
MKRISLSCLAILTSVAALACATTAEGASAEELHGSGIYASEVSTQASTKAASVVFHVGSGLYLGSPKVTAEEHLEFLKPLTNVGYDVGYDLGAGFRLAYKDSEATAAGEVSWPVLDAWGARGKDTGITVTARLGFGQGWGQSCTVTDQDGEVTREYQCSLVRRGWDHDWDMYVTDDYHARIGAEEASGSITADGSLLLVEGQYDRGPSHLVEPGARSVAAKSSTQFDAINWGPSAEAGMQFRYAIFDDGKEVLGSKGTPLYVVGSVAKGKRQAGTSDCHFVHIADSHEVPDSSAPYSCSYDSHLDGAVMLAPGNYITDFTVSYK